MSIIWVFREQRSGGTAFTNKLAYQLHRQNVMASEDTSLSDIINIENPHEYLFDTHTFEHLETVSSHYDTPILLIRCARRDKVEQCLSLLLVRWINSGRTLDQLQYNFHTDEIYDETIFSTATPTLFTKKEVLNYFDNASKIEQLWNMYALKHDNITVYYEDLCEGVDIPNLGIQNFTIAEGETHTAKLPLSYKEQLCLNHSMIRGWINQIQCPGGGMVDTQR